MRVRAGRQPDLDAKRSSRSVSALLCLLSLAAISCKARPSEGEPAWRQRASGPSWRARANGPTQAQTPAAAEPSDPLFANGQPLEAPSSATPREESARSAPPEVPAAQPEAVEAKPARDFSAELVQMMGSPTDCLQARTSADAPNHLDIALATRVMPSGAVAHSEVSAAGLEASELACLRGRVEALHFAGPIENAPFAVHGSVHLTRAATPAPTVPSADEHANGDGTPSEPAAAPTPTDTPL
jgi:hypothetical protein